jgi:hypothetical protein
MYNKEMGCEGVYWIHLAQDSDQMQALSGSKNGGGFLD